MLLLKEYNKQYNNINHISPMKMARSASDQNVFSTYVCLINEVKPSLSGNNNDKNSMERGQGRSLHVMNSDEVVQDHSIKVERTKALYELVETNPHNTISDHETDRKFDASYYEDDSDPSDNEEYNQYVNPKKLKLTKMKWLSEGREGSIDSSSQSLTSSSSNNSTCSRESADGINHHHSFGEKCLSTILKLDREHNMFGLSNITIVGKKTSKKIRKEDVKPAFPQTAIIQMCCTKGCCKNKSNTDLPASLKCGGCRSCCFDPYCSVCVGSCDPPCVIPPCPSLCSQCSRAKCSCKSLCQPSKCRLDCNNCYGLKVSFKRKPKYEPSPLELTPRSSCILQKPMAARSCHHFPQCLPPSSCFPYLMPCYWPARAGAPCNHPSKCFHNPPCRAPRRIKYPIPPEERCPTTGKCIDESKNTKCENQLCLGNNPSAKSAIESRFGGKK
ncbi:uncharacterized protein LOC124535716 [Vanessa cardui]|uniref:uncharacterized protein LOC124535716 n=1 Tax=Vanessa cardui TaxID=171605 RepID=UPI001F148844|nr:uncharacterized protein LOC124535716 [Vanessa cardui]